MTLQRNLTKCVLQFKLWEKLQPAVRASAFLVGLAVLFTQVNAHAADKFKPFKLKMLDGTAKTLQDYPGKATLVSFFFPSCPYCNAAFPEVQKIYDKYKVQGLSTVWINVVPDENKKIPDWLEKHQFTIPVLIGASQASLQRDYKLKMTPTHYLLNSAGDILFTHAGYEKGDEKELEEQIQKALSNIP
ncbi:MAG: TlpA family protein disulfide reductase [Acidobacteria bacterium]|nr:TlpA family protein disulfide reductase [Acidobacteriota bacterium]